MSINKTTKIVKNEKLNKWLINLYKTLKFVAL